jgi:sRNA-binding regulator protein Hfq
LSSSAANQFEYQFLGRHADSGVICVLTNDTQLSGCVLDWDFYNILLKTDERNYMIRKAAVKYLVAVQGGSNPDEPRTPAGQLEKWYFAKQIADKTPLRFVFPSGKSLTGIPVAVDSYTVWLVKDGREILLPKHAYLYFSKVKGSAAATAGGEEAAPASE